MLDIPLETRYGRLGTVGTLGTVRLVRFARLVSWYDWYGANGTLLTTVWLGGWRKYGDIGTARPIPWRPWRAYFFCTLATHCAAH